MLPKGQQKLTTFSDLVEEGLSYLQLFLELPDLIWGLRNVYLGKKRPQNLRIHESCHMALADGMKSRLIAINFLRGALGTLLINKC